VTWRGRKVKSFYYKSGKLRFPSQNQVGKLKVWLKFNARNTHANSVKHKISIFQSFLNAAVTSKCTRKTYFKKLIFYFYIRLRKNHTVEFSFNLSNGGSGDKTYLGTSTCSFCRKLLYQFDNFHVNKQVGVEYTSLLFRSTPFW